jgi:hypothetical protein
MTLLRHLGVAAESARTERRDSLSPLQLMAIHLLLTMGGPGPL